MRERQGRVERGGMWPRRWHATRGLSSPSSATSGDDDDDDKLKEDSLREAPSHSNGRKGMDTRGLKEEDQPVVKTVIISHFKWAIKIIDVV